MLELPVLIEFISQQLLFRGNISMESSFRLADAVNSMTPPGTHRDLGCKVIPTITSLSGFWNVHLMAVHKTVTPPLSS